MKLRSLILAMAISGAAAGCSTLGGVSLDGQSAGDLCDGLVEKDCLARTDGLASRKGDVLRLKMASGKAVEFASTPNACEANSYETCLIYTLTGYRPDEGLFVMKIGLTEGAEFTVLDRRSRGQSKVENFPPRFSQSGRHFVGVMSSEAHIADFDLAVWSAGGSAPSLKWSHKPQEGYAIYEFVSWEGDARVRLKVSYSPTGGGPNKDAEASIVRSGEGWSLEKPADCP